MLASRACFQRLQQTLEQQQAEICELQNTIAKLQQVQYMLIICRLFYQAIWYASQRTWCLSQVRVNWKDSGREGIWHKNAGDDGGRGTD